MTAQTLTADQKWKRRLQRQTKIAWAKGYLDGAVAMMGPGDIAVDCGANVGVVTTQLASTGATVYAFEPDPVAFAALSKAVEGMENVTLINAAVGTRDGTVTLMRSNKFEDDPLAATVSSTIVDGKRDYDDDDSNSVEVELADLAKFLKGLGKRAKLKLLKLDVEGEELTLVPHLDEQGLLDKFACTLVETHQRKFPDKRRAFMDMRKAISDKYPAQKVNLDWI